METCLLRELPFFMFSSSDIFRLIRSPQFQPSSLDRLRDKTNPPVSAFVLPLSHVPVCSSFRMALFGMGTEFWKRRERTGCWFPWQSARGPLHRFVTSIGGAQQALNENAVCFARRATHRPRGGVLGGPFLRCCV